MSVNTERALIRRFAGWACAILGAVSTSVVVAVWTGWGFPSEAGASGNRPTSPKATRGFTYENKRIESIPWSVHVGKLDRANKDYELHSILAKDTVIGLNKLSEQIRTFPPELGRPIAGINGDFYHIDRGPYQGDPNGLQIMQGELVSAPNDWTCFWLDANGDPQMTNVLALFNVTFPGGANIPIGFNEERTNNAAVLYTPRLGPSTLTEGGRELVLERDDDKPWLPLQIGDNYTARVRQVREAGNTPLTSDTIVLSINPQMLSRLPAVKPGDIIKISTSTLPDLKGCKTAIGGGPPLVRNGKVGEWKTTQFRHPRTAVGWNSNFIYIVEVDGRQRGLSVGMTYPELADFMLKLGCENALNLDGGGSATFWLYGQVVSSPSEGQERTTANGLVVVRKPKNPAPVQNPD
jgi:large repetitive protein